MTQCFAAGTAEDLAWSTKLLFVLCAAIDTVPSAEIIDSMPDSVELDSFVVDIAEPCLLHHWRLRAGPTSLQLLAALVCAARPHCRLLMHCSLVSPPR